MAKYTDEQIKSEIPEEKSLRWLAINFPKIENPKDDIERMQNCIHAYCANGADLIKRQEAEIERLKDKIAEYPNRVLCSKGLILTKSLTEYDELINDISAEAIKEFAERFTKAIEERLSEGIKAENPDLYLIHKILNDLVKERVGESNG